MALSRSYLELKIGVAGSVIRFRVLAEESDITGYLSLATFTRAISGNLIAVRSSLQPRLVRGLILLRETDNPPYGNQSDLYTFWTSDDLYVRAHGDADFWQGTITNDFSPRGLEQNLRYITVATIIEQKQ